MKNAKLTNAFSLSVPKVMQATVDMLLLNFICEGTQPFSVVERPLFKKMSTVYSHDEENLMLEDTRSCPDNEEHNHQEIEYREPCCYHNGQLVCKTA